MPSYTVKTAEDVDKLAQSIRVAADGTVRALRDILSNEGDNLQVLRMMKFEEIGHHPTEPRRLNIIEQVNQTFTYLVTVEAARVLMVRHPEALGLRINLGTAAGFDLESVVPEVVAAEAFAATHPRSNDKLRKDIQRLVEQAPSVQHRYVFFSCPGFTEGRQPQLEPAPDVIVWSLPTDLLLRVRGQSGPAGRCGGP
jgi:hypothetical protein